MRALLVLLGLWACGLVAALGVWMWFGLVGPALVLGAAASAAVLFFGVDTDPAPESVEPEDPRAGRRVPGL